MDTNIWQGFSTDPRQATAAPLRASDADREHAASLLAAAYADGRLSAEEHDERGTAATSASTLGELAGLLRDLAAQAGPAPSPGASARATATPPRSGGKCADKGWQTILLVPAVCWTIWLLTTPGGFPWPLFPTLAVVWPLLAGGACARVRPVASRQS